MSSISPPEFKNSTKCQACGALFGLINRKHHCRNCGNTFCAKCSQKSSPLPTYGFVEPVRVCDKCYDDLRATQSFADSPRKSERAETQAEDGDSKVQPSSTSSSSRVPATDDDVADEEGSSSEAPTGEEKKETRKRVANCKCKMPLCICPADPETEEEKEEREKKEGKSVKKVERKKAPPASSTSSNIPSPTSQPTFVGFGQKTTRQYDLKGDLNNQCREAVKAQDLDGVKMLLKAGAKADYKDRTGNTLLHLAAMFDNTELVKVLIAAGADPWIQNPGKESPIDIAPPALAAKMKSLAPKKEA